MGTPFEPDPYDIAFEELIPARGQTAFVCSLHEPAIRSCTPTVSSTMVIIVVQTVDCSVWPVVM